MDTYCVYYQAHIVPEKGWLFAGILRSHEHVVFDRTLDVDRSIFEFFVPAAYESEFCALMDYFVRLGIARDVQKLPNRLIEGGPCF